MKRMLLPYVGFLVLFIFSHSYFHIRSSSKSISFINAKMGVVHGVVLVFPGIQPTLLQF